MLAEAMADDGMLFCDCAEIPRLEKGPHGKPYYPDLPGFAFNFSHSGDWIVLAVRDGANIGIDLQKIVPVKSGIDAIAERCCRPEETAFLHFCRTEETPSLRSCGRDESAEKAEIFFRLWAIREAFLKYTGDGIFHNDIKNVQIPVLSSLLSDWIIMNNDADPANDASTTLSDRICGTSKDKAATLSDGFIEASLGQNELLISKELLIRKVLDILRGSGEVILELEKSSSCACPSQKKAFFQMVTPPEEGYIMCVVTD